MLLKHLTKLAFSALFCITVLGAPLHAAGTIPLALAIQFDTQGAVASNCQLTLFQAGTVATKQQPYADFSLTQPLSNPLSCDQSGRVPMFWLADGLIHARLTTFDGLTIVDTTMQVLGPSSGGGGGGSTVDPTTIFQTGALMPFYGTGPRSGFVRANGLTIGNASSGASERANADTQALFVYLCGADANLVMTPARSGNCLNDYNANKQLATPDWRGRAIAALDDMGNSPALRLDSSLVSPNATTLGAAGGVGAQTLTLADLPTGITSSVTQNITVSSSVGNIAQTTGGIASVSSPNTGGTQNFPNTSGTWSGTGSLTSPNTITVTSTNTSGSSFSNVQPSKLATIYIKL